MIDLEFYKNKKIFITGHTGFKGTWLTKILLELGAKVKGYSLKPEKNSLFNEINIVDKIENCYGDIRDFERLLKEFLKFEPEIVIHMAAQALVIKSYEQPRYTYETNCMGTVNILECIRNSKSVKSFLNVTTDKVYYNIENINYLYTEADKLNGYDPYSNSKSCSELITDSYKRSFLKKIAISTARAGNVIGGGDYAKNRIIPDCIRAMNNKNKVIIRNPDSIRPYQHVLDALFAYLLIIQKQYDNNQLSGNYNIGPDNENAINTENLVKIFCKNCDNQISYELLSIDSPHESNYLKLNCEKMRNTFNWKPKWDIEKSVQKVIEFERSIEKEKSMEKQIQDFLL